LYYLARGRSFRAKGGNKKAIADFRKVLELTEDPNLRKEAEKNLRDPEIR
jgi:hypothetical protein